MPDTSLSDRELPERVEDLICFALYSTSHAISRAYAPLLKPLGLTYPQYIVLTALWDRDGQTNKQLCDRLLLDPSTLTPLIKRLERDGLVTRTRGTEDERMVFVSLTAQGQSLKAQAPDITRCIIDQTGTPMDELGDLMTRVLSMRDSFLTQRK